MLPPGTVLFTSRAGIGKTAILTRKGCTNQGFQSIVPHRGELDSYFIFSRTEELKRYGELVGAGSTFVEVSGKQMAVMELMMPPTMREQQTIGGFFQQLDHLITLHQRECISFTARAGRRILTANKKRNTSSWEQRKCGDVLNERNIQHPQSEEFPLVSFTVENGVTSKTERYEREQLVRGSKEAKKYKETRLDDIVYNPANLKFGAIARNKLGNAVFSPIYVTYEVDKSLALPSFVEMFVTRNNFIQNALQYQQGTVYERMSVSTADFATLDITLPSIAEQKQIGQYFQQLDHLITLHQRKPFLMKWRTSDANRNKTNRLVL